MTETRILPTKAMPIRQPWAWLIVNGREDQKPCLGVRAPRPEAAPRCQAHYACPPSWSLPASAPHIAAAPKPRTPTDPATRTTKWPGSPQPCDSGTGTGMRPQPLPFSNQSVLSGLIDPPSRAFCRRSVKYARAQPMTPSAKPTAIPATQAAASHVASDFVSWSISVSLWMIRPPAPIQYG